MRNCDEHQEFIDLLKENNPQKAAKVLKDVHWSYEFQEKFIKAFYNA